MRENRSLLSALGLSSIDRPRTPAGAGAETSAAILARLDQIELRLSAIEASLAKLSPSSD